MSDALRSFRHGVTPQTEQARSDEVVNNAGGYVFEVDDRTRLNRFLTLGTEGGTYYVDEQKLTRDNAGLVVKMAEGNDRKLIADTVMVSHDGRAPRNQPALFAMAAAAGLGNTDYRHEALDFLPQVARTGYHLLVWAEYIEMFRGWGPQLVKGVANWYKIQSPEDLAYQILKYKQREGWSQRDLMRLANGAGGLKHGATPEQAAVFNYVMKGTFDADRLPVLIFAAEQAHATRDVRSWVALIEQYRSLSHEMLPSEALAKAEVWEALVNSGNLPLGALLRNLSRLTRLGVFKQMDAWTTSVCMNRLLNTEAIRKARIHPIQVLLALKTYALGHSIQGTSTWQPVPQVIDALNEMFYLAFGNVVPSGKRTAICLDVSSSMNNTVSGYPFRAREISAAMALITMKTEPQYAAMAFSHQFVPLNISASQRLDDVVRSISNLPFGRTDCALPMAWAQYNNLAVDTFQVWTDNETWYGPNGHPHEALKSYRRATGINARLQVAAITPTQFSIADPLDPGQLDVSGFDAAVPKLMADHARGDI